jgi:ubiquinone/menaquinone biosynthesis C-methylase UbiE
MSYDILKVDFALLYSRRGIMGQKSWLDFWDQCAEQKENPIEAVQYLKGEHPLTEQEYKNVIKLVDEYLTINPTDRVLEVGCGCGLILNELAPEAKIAIGIDYSPQMIAKAQKLFPDIPFLVGEAANIPFPAHYFNRTFCFSIFAYFQDLAYAERAINEFVRVTVPGGTALLGDIIKPPDLSNRTLIRKAASRLFSYRRYISRLLKKPPPLTTLTIEPNFIKKILKNLDVQDFRLIMRDNPPYALQETRYDVIIRI